MADEDVRFRWRDNNFYKMRSEPQIIAVLEAIGREVVEKANAQVEPTRGLEAYGMVSSQGARRPYGRWHVRVYTQTNAAKRYEAENNTLVRLTQEAAN
jgi:hypothetical protein